MNVLWTKGNFHKIFSTENVNLHASGDGAAAGRCCRLCGGDTRLRALGDTYVWEGVEERYDQLLYDCFGVRVSTSDCLICEWCVRQLRNTERFKALVHAAFDKPSSPSIASPTLTPPTNHVEPFNNENVGIIDNKTIIELLKTKMSTEKKKRRRHEKPLEVKRTTVQCKMCKQKYIMIMASERCKEFVCSRCKKNIEKPGVWRKLNMAMPAETMHLKADLRGKCRLPSLTKKPSEMKKQENISHSRIAKFKCSICPKKYTTSKHLVEHITLVHGECRKNTCVLCGKNFRTKETLDKHIQLHIDQKHFNNSSCGSSKARHPSKMHGFAREKRSV